MVVTRLERMLMAARKLPADMAGLFHDLFILEKSDEAVCAERNISPQQLAEQRDRLLRTLRAAAA